MKNKHNASLYSGLENSTVSQSPPLLNAFLSSSLEFYTHFLYNVIKMSAKVKIQCLFNKVDWPQESI